MQPRERKFWNGADVHCKVSQGSESEVEMASEVVIVSMLPLVLLCRWSLKGVWERGIMKIGKAKEVEAEPLEPAEMGKTMQSSSGGI